MTAVAHSDPYSQEQAVVKDKKKKKKSLVHPPLSLVQWSSQHWKDCMALLTSTRDLMLRKDADLLVDYEAEENDDEHEERANSDLYSVKLERLLVYMRIHRAMAAFRASMEQQLAHQDSAEAVKVEPSILAKFGYDRVVIGACLFCSTALTHSHSLSLSTLTVRSSKRTLRRMKSLVLPWRVFWFVVARGPVHDRTESLWCRPRNCGKSWAESPLRLTSCSANCLCCFNDGLETSFHTSLPSLNLDTAPTR